VVPDVSKECSASIFKCPTVKEEWMDEFSVCTDPH
jgi:hypothetical protein